MDPWWSQYVSHLPQDLTLEGAILGSLLGGCRVILEGVFDDSSTFGPSNFARGDPKGVFSVTPFGGIYFCNSNVFGKFGGPIWSPYLN